jgi:membrane protein DedA with SNARE-associated domain
MILELIQSIITSQNALIENYGFIGVFVAMILQSIIPIAIPSDAVVIGAVVLGIDNIAVIIASTLGSTIGGIIGFSITRKGGKPLAVRFIGKKNIERLENWFEKWGNFIIVFGRAMPFLSSDAIAYAAGLTKINIKLFIPLALLGAFLRSLILVYLGDKLLEYIPKIL